MEKNLKNKIKYTKLFQAYKFGYKKNIVYDKKNKTSQYKKILKSLNIFINPDKVFQHWIDEDIITVNIYSVIGNMPPDYSLILENSIEDLLKKYSDRLNNVSKQNYEFLLAVNNYIDKIINKIESVENKTYNLNRSLSAFYNMKTQKAASLYDALQRILFWSSLFWQFGHKLVGIGRLDKLLNEFSHNLNEEDKNILKEFVLELHNYYEYKSASLLGDIGQIIILGGKEENGTYFENEITYCLMNIISELKITDPKILLRVSSSMSEKLLDISVECLASGCGSPLFSNDDVVIELLQKFGYEKEDAYNYVTSACWEPLSYGNSLEQNNLDNINFAKAFSDMMESERVCECNCFDEVLSLYKDYLKKDIYSVCCNIDKIVWEESPLYTLFVQNCSISGHNIEDGGARYNNYGILSVGLGNAVNSLIAINQFVFEEHKLSLKDLYRLFKNKSYNEIMKIGEKTVKSYGHDYSNSVNISNIIIDYATNEVKNYRNYFGGKIKFGLSSPSYLNQKNSETLTLDGRNYGDAYDVHISSRDEVAYTELISFASKLNYNEYCCNGNVVDFFVSPYLITDNKEKFKKFIRISILQGFFQMQMNIVSSETLIKAQNNPELFPDLIVRVWGFSAYFNDLPKEYQDVLIKRALVSEGKA